MKRIIVIGGPGSGKSTLARALGEKLDLPVTHMDQLFWLPGWVMQDKEALFLSVSDLVQRDAWITEGNYQTTLPVRMARADAIIALNMPRLLCFWRVLKRTILSYGHERIDMPQGCPERLDIEFLKYVWNYKRDKHEEHMQLISDFDGRIFLLNSKQEVSGFLESLKSGGS